MQLTYRGISYQISTSQGSEAVDTHILTYRGIDYTTPQPFPTTVTALPNRRIYRGAAY